jgi:hypothetical protein
LRHEEVERLRKAAGGSKHTFERVRKRAPEPYERGRRRR